MSISTRIHFSRSLGVAAVLLLCLLCASFSLHVFAGRSDLIDNDIVASKGRGLLTWGGWGWPTSDHWGNGLWYGNHWWYGAPAADSPVAPDAPTSPPVSNDPGNQDDEEPDRWQCGRMELNAEYKGNFVDSLSEVSDPGTCCSSCKMTPGCNIWVFCGIEGGCDTGSGNTYDMGSCILKSQMSYDFTAGEAPHAYSRGGDVPWCSGVIYLEAIPDATSPAPTSGAPQPSPTTTSPTTVVPQEPQPTQPDNPPAMCNEQTPLVQNTLFGGEIVDKLQTDSALMCCQCCLDDDRCNTWSWCDETAGDGGCLNSRSSGWKHAPKTCLLKKQERLNSNPGATPTVLLTGNDVDYWTAGLKGQ